MTSCGTSALRGAVGLRCPSRASPISSPDPGWGGVINASAPPEKEMIAEYERRIEQELMQTPEWEFDNATFTTLYSGDFSLDATPRSRCSLPRIERRNVGRAQDYSFWKYRVRAGPLVLPSMARHDKAPNAPKRDDPIVGLSMWTSTEVMAVLRINRATLCRWCRAGIIPYTRMPDNSYRFDTKAIQMWIADRSLGGAA
jgi:hypothetical protein